MGVARGDERGTTERVLTLLGLLQQRQVWTGPELADRLGVTPPTVRRDVERHMTALTGLVVRSGTLKIPQHSSSPIDHGFSGNTWLPYRRAQNRRSRSAIVARERAAWWLGAQAA
jgi:DeoR/GlpR family transcriptional regulator of sugar metabolism